MYENTKLTIHGAPVIINSISFSLMLRTYMKYVHNRPYYSGLNAPRIETQKLNRNRQLAFFCLMGAPLTMFMIKCSAIPFKNMFDITIGGNSQVENNNYNTINSIIFLSYFNKKIPRWLKIFFKILFVTLVILKL